MAFVGIGSGPELSNHRQQNDRGHNKNRQERHACRGAAIKEITDGKQSGPNDGATGDPSEQSEGNVLAGFAGLGGGEAGLLANASPAGSEGFYPVKEFEQSFFIGRRSVKGGEDPADCGYENRDREVEGQGADGGFDAELVQGEKDQGRDEGTDHGGHFAPGVNAPPEPAQEIEQAGAGADLEDDVEGVLGGIEKERQDTGANEEADGGQPSGPDIMMFGGVAANEPAIKIVNQVRGAPIEVGEDGGGISRDQAADHKADETDGEEGQHRRVGHIVSEQGGVDPGKSGFDIRQVRVDEQGTEGDEDPGPGAQHIMGDVKKEDGPEGILFRFGREHALGDVAAAAGFGAGIPDGPPLHGNGQHEHGDGDFPIVGEVGEDVEVLDTAGAAFCRNGGDHGGEAADMFDGEPGGGDDSGHLDEELDHVDDQDAPQAGMGGEHDIEHAANQQGFPAGQAEENIGNLAGGEADGGHDEAVEEEPEVYGAEAADDRGGLAGVTDFVELEIGHDARTAPEAGVEENGRHTGQGKSPPTPIAGDALLADDIGDEVGGIAAESGGDHGEAGEPPRHGAAGDEKLGGIFAGAFGEEQGRKKADEECRQDNQPINEL